MKIAILLSRIPWPLDKGDKLRAYYQLRELAKKHEIHLFALYQKDIPKEARKELQPFCKQIHFMQLSAGHQLLNLIISGLKGEPFQKGYFYNHKASKGTSIRFWKGLNRI
jgi:hypothetical protein